MRQKFLNFPQRLGEEDVHFGGGVVKIKAGACGRIHAELFHQKRLVAVMPAAQGHAALIGHGDDVVGVNVLQQKADHARVTRPRAKRTEAGQAR